MARPKGSKNKTVTITATSTGEVKQRKPRAEKINWEVLAKQLQQALASEIKDNDGLKKQLAEANRALVQMSGIIQYLEGKRGHNPV